ncbi:MAG: TetR family transcriptional regulator [Alphaproteobacteria bacterium]|nr:TetR family transcriptional regulator [Alphaproteobacteria bacterium]
MSAKTSPDRLSLVTRAAVEVLGLEGAAGLTHRAVDRHAGLPEGSTSNHLRTRDALINAISQFLTDHDLATISRTAATFESQSALSLESAADALAAIVQRWTDKEAVLTTARLELFLIAYRDPEFAARFAEVRRTFRARASDWLDALSPGAGRHAGLLMALIEGLTSNQLLHAEGRMSRNEMKQAFRLALSALVEQPATVPPSARHGSAKDRRP